MKNFNSFFNSLVAMPKRLAMVLTVLFTLGVGSMWAQTFTRISSASELSNGDEIIFVNQAGTHACGTTQNTNNRTPVAITTSSKSYSYKSTDNVQVFVVKVNGSNYGFHTGNGYIYSASTSNNYLKTNTTASTTSPTGTSAWTLSVSDNVFTVQNTTNTSYYLAFNSTSYFSQYKSGQSKPYIYKKQTSSGGENTGGDSGDDSGDSGDDGDFGDGEWVETEIANISSTDIVVVTMTNSSGTYAMSNSNGTSSAPTATEVTVSENTLSGEIAEALQWNISNSNGSLTLYPNGTTEKWLYCTSTNNGVRVGTNTAKAFTIDATSGYLKHTGTSRYLGVYNSADWRCYTSYTTDNIKNQTLKFYKKSETTDCNKFAFSTDLTASVECNINDVITLTVEAQYDSKASNNITYQWYSNTTNSTTGGSVIAGVTSAAYQPSTDALSEKYYYCVASYKGECEISSAVTRVTTHFCDNYTFHTGGDGVKVTNTPTCFTQASSTTEWQITNYTIPSDTKFFVGKQGWWYDEQLGNNNSRSVAKTWSEAMYLAPSMDASNANGSPKVGQATGAVGTLRIFDNSNWDNLYVGFIPNGYKLKFGTTEYAFTHKENSEYLSDIVEYNATSANYNASAGITNASGDYVATDHTQEMRHIFVKDDIGWRNDGAKLAIYYWNGSTNGWCGFLKTVPGDATLFEGWVPAAATNIKLVRYNSSKGNPGDWNDIWNQTGDLTISNGKNLFTITDWGTGSWSAYSRKGKFRIYNDSKDKNCYLHFYPHNVLTYHANSGSGTMASQSVPADAASKSVTISANGFTRSGYRFTGWNTQAIGSGTSYAAGSSSSPVPATTIKSLASIDVYVMFPSFSVPE